MNTQNHVNLAQALNNSRITMIIPTRDRAHTLRYVMPSFYEQAQVSEIIFVSDAGQDDTESVIAECAARYPQVTTKFLRNPKRRGAAASRNAGVAQASNDYILFCDDDEYLEKDYARTCLHKLVSQQTGAVSGRHVYLKEGETPEQALIRFGDGLFGTAPFRLLICEHVNAARYHGDIRLPITSAVILTHKYLLERFPYDNFYARGNGYREESDYQMNLFVNGYDIIVTNECHSFHLPMSQVRTGGQRTQCWKRVYWSIYYTRYFYSKYYESYANRAGLRAPAWLAVAVFSLFAIYRETLQPPLYAAAYWLLQRARLPGTQSSTMNNDKF